MKKQVCKDCYYAGFDKCDHVKKLTNKQEVMEKESKNWVGWLQKRIPELKEHHNVFWLQQAIEAIENQQPQTKETFLKAAEVEVDKDCHCSNEHMSVENIDVIKDVCKAAYMRCANWAYDTLTKNQK